jgi:hypothetical protein
LNVYACLLAKPELLLPDNKTFDATTAEILSEGAYIARRNVLMRMETVILRGLGFQTHVALPYTLAINYLQALDALSGSTSSELAQRVFEHLNTGLLSPQSIYLTFQPAALATAAIYFAAREVGVKLPDTEWWEVFDVDREELGFLVVAMGSMKGFVEHERQQWGSSLPPMTVEAIETELLKAQKEV